MANEGGTKRLVAPQIRVCSTTLLNSSIAVFTTSGVLYG